MNAFAINNSTASLAPYSCRWRELPIGVDGNGQTIYSGFREIDLSFDSASISYSRQWTELSAGSFNLDTLDKYSLGYVTLSGVRAIINEFPSVESINSGPFSITITRV